MNCLRNLVHLTRRVNTVNSIRWQQPSVRMCSNDSKRLIIKKPNNVTKDLPNDDLENEMMEIYEEEEKNRTRSILAPVEDESKIYAEPTLQPTYNLAAYVQKSETLQKLISLGVNLYKLELSGHGEFIVKLDFDRDIQPYIILLCKDIGLDPNNLGNFFTKNILILKQSHDDILARVNYLQFKRFTKKNIVQIITQHPKWLNYSTKEIDRRLGYFQNQFKLTGDEVRSLTLERPKTITSDLDVVRDATFSLRTEFGFEDVNDLKKIILKEPILLEYDRLRLMNVYDYVTRVMKISNEQLVLDPTILKRKILRIKERHGFLKKIGRVQYDPKLPLYVSLTALCTGNDAEFCDNVAKRPYEEYDEYLRSL